MKKYSATLRQVDTNNPTAVVCSNQISNQLPAWSYDAPGDYILTSTGSFDGDVHFPQHGQLFHSSTNGLIFRVECSVMDSDRIRLRTRYVVTGTCADECLAEFYFEVLTSEKLN